MDRHEIESSFFGSELSVSSNFEHISNINIAQINKLPTNILFDKKKDLKYGKGHKLGDKPTQIEEPVQVNPVYRPQTSSQTDAARAAGQAALARLQNSKII